MVISPKGRGRGGIYSNSSVYQITNQTISDGKYDLVHCNLKDNKECVTYCNIMLFVARITEHMLEKSRVVHSGAGERSFHIFYYMFAGLTDREKYRYFLGKPEQYRSNTFTV